MKFNFNSTPGPVFSNEDVEVVVILWCDWILKSKRNSKLETWTFSLKVRARFFLGDRTAT